LEDAHYDSIAMRAFAGVDLAAENALDATTLLKFRRMLVEYDLTRRSTRSAPLIVQHSAKKPDKPAGPALRGPSPESPLFPSRRPFRVGGGMPRINPNN
jgi:hypothetical protein